MMWLTCFALLLRLFLIGDLDEFKCRRIEAVKTDNPPKIDGKLDDPCWKNAPKASNFIDSSSALPAANQTEALILYDDNFLYVAFKCFDSNPQNIIAKETKRDGNPWNDDFVEVALNPFNTKRREGRNTFKVNAIGTQFTQIWSGRAEKAEWKGNWLAAVSRTEFGWTAEIAIPWDIMEMPSKKEPMNIGINFARYRPTSDTFSFWSYIGRRGSFRFEWDGELVGVRVKRKRELEIKLLGYILGGFDGGKAAGRAGLDLKLKPSPQVSLLLTLNPDFSNVEQEVETIDFPYFERAYSDRRPFFMEGRGVFGMEGDVRPFYSRRIGAIDAGLKLFGRAGRTSFGWMSCADLDRWNLLLVCAGRDLSKNITGRGSYLRYDEGDLESDVLSVRLRWRVKGLSGELSLSGSREGKRRGSRGSVSLSYVLGKLFARGSLAYISPGYSLPVGLLPYQPCKGGSASIVYEDRRFWGGNLLNVGVFGYELRRYEGGDYIGMISPWVRLVLRRGEREGCGLTASFESTRFGGVRDRLFSLRPELFVRRKLFSLELNPSLSVGSRLGERYLFLRPEVGVVLGRNRFVLRWWSEFMRHGDESGRQHVVWLNFNVTPERSLGGRLVVRGGEWNGYFAFRQGVREGVDVYLIGGDPNSESFRRRGLVKFLLPGTWMMRM